MAVLTRIAKRNLNTPDETRPFGSGKLELVNLEDVSIARITLMPGWSWEKDVKPMVNTQSCQVSHTQYCLQGHLRVKMDDGSELELEPGDAAVIGPGHTAEVVGSEPFVAIDFTGGPQYAQRSPQAEPDWDEMMNIE